MGINHADAESLESEDDDDPGMYACWVIASDIKCICSWASILCIGAALCDQSCTKTEWLCSMTHFIRHYGFACHFWGVYSFSF